MTTSGNSNGTELGDLWPLGQNLDLFLAIQEHIHYVLKHHGVRLTETQLVYLSKIKSSMDSLLVTTHGVTRSSQCTLPVIYKHYVDSNSTVPHDDALPLIQSGGLPRPSTPSAESSESSILPVTTSSVSMSNRPMLKSNTKSNQSAPVLLQSSPPPIPKMSTSHSTDDQKTMSPPPLPSRFSAASTSLTPPPNPTSSRRPLPVNLLTPPPIPSSVLSTAVTLEPSRAINGTATKSKSLQSFNPTIRQNVTLKGYFNAYLSVFTDGRCQCTRTEVTIDEILTITPIRTLSDHRHTVYIQTQEKLYLGSDHNGFLFLGNVTKPQQIWTVETSVSGIVVYLRSNYGSYLCAHKSGHVAADGKKRNDWVTFRVHVVDSLEHNLEALQRNVALPPPPIPLLKPPPLTSSRDNGDVKERKESPIPLHTHTPPPLTSADNNQEEPKKKSKSPRHRRNHTTQNLQQELKLKLNGMAHHHSSSSSSNISDLKLKKQRSITVTSQQMQETIKKSGINRRATNSNAAASSGGSMVEELKRKLLERQRQSEIGFTKLDCKNIPKRRAPPRKSPAEVVNDLKSKRKRALPPLPPRT